MRRAGYQAPRWPRRPDRARGSERAAAASAPCHSPSSGAHTRALSPGPGSPHPSARGTTVNRYHTTTVVGSPFGFSPFGFGGFGLFRPVVYMPMGGFFQMLLLVMAAGAVFGLVRVRGAAGVTVCSWGTGGRRARPAQRLRMPGRALARIPRPPRPVWAQQRTPPSSSAPHPRTPPAPPRQGAMSNGKKAKKQDDWDSL